MEENHNIVCIKNINHNSADIVKNKKHINNSLSIPSTSIILNKINNTQNKRTSSAVKNFDQSAKALGMSLTQSVTKGKAGQHAATSTPVLSNADSGATGNYIRLYQQNKSQLQLPMEIYYNPHNTVFWMFRITEP